MRAWASERFLAYSRASLLSALFLVPVLFNRSTIDTFEIVKITTLWAFAVIGLSAWIIWKTLNREPFPSSMIIRVGVGFIAVVALATALSNYRLISLLGLYERYGGLVSYVLYGSMMVLTASLYRRRPNQLKDVCAAVTVAATVVAGSATLQAAGMDWNQWLNGQGVPIDHPIATLGNPNLAGAYLGVCLPFGIFMACTSIRRTTRFLFAVMASLQVFALWLSGSRAGMLAASTTGLVFAAAYRRGVINWFAGLSTKTKRSVLTGFGTLVLVLGIVLSNVVGVQSIRQVFEPSTLLVRTTYWQTASRIFGDHPIIGTGPDTYYAFHPRYRIPREGARNGLILPDEPHNIFLDHATGTGVVGLAAFLTLLAVAVWVTARWLRQSERGPQKLLAVTFLAALSGYAVQGFFSVDAPALTMVAWVCLGAISTIVSPAPISKKRGTTKRVRPASKVWWSSGVALTMILLLSIGLRPLIADAKADSANNARRLPEKLLLYGQAQHLNPAEAEYHYLAGRALHRRAISLKDQTRGRILFERGLREMDRALQLKPGRVPYLGARAAHITEWAQAADPRHFSEADKAWRRVLSLDSSNYQLRSSYTQMLERWASASNDRTIHVRLVSELRTLLRLRHNQPDAWIRLSNAYRSIGRADKADQTLKAFFGRIITRGEQEHAQEEATALPPAFSPYRRGLGPSLGLGIFAVAGVCALAFSLGRLLRTPLGEAPALPFHPGKVKIVELLGGTALWSMAVSLPYLGPLYGLAPLPGEVAEITRHFLPGLVMFSAVVWILRKMFVRTGSSSQLSTIALAALGLATALMALGHLPDLFQHHSDLGSWAKTLIHLAPGVVTVGLFSSLLRTNRG